MLVIYPVHISSFEWFRRPTGGSIDPCIIVWGMANQTHLECPRVRLNKVLWIILSCGIETPINKMYITLQFLKIDDI